MNKIICFRSARWTEQVQDVPGRPSDFLHPDCTRAPPSGSCRCLWHARSEPRWPDLDRVWPTLEERCPNDRQTGRARNTGIDLDDAHTFENYRQYLRSVLAGRRTDDGESPDRKRARCSNGPTSGFAPISTNANSPGRHFGACADRIRGRNCSPRVTVSAKLEGPHANSVNRRLVAPVAPQCRSVDDLARQLNRALDLPIYAVR